MTLEETVDLLTAAAAFDRRTVGKADAVAWHAVLGDLDFQDAQAAVIAHYRDSREWIMPADVRTRVKAMRRDRLERGLIPAPPAELADDPARYRASLGANIRQIADGRSARRALGPAGPSGVPESFTEARKKLGPALPRSTPRNLAAEQAAESRKARENTEGDPAA